LVTSCRERCSSPTLHDTFGNGGIYGTIDAHRYFGFVGAGQSILLSGFLDYRRDNLSIAADPSLAPPVGTIAPLPPNADIERTAHHVCFGPGTSARIRSKNIPLFRCRATVKSVTDVRTLA
jgi:hypothetical protein